MRGVGIGGGIEHRTVGVGIGGANLGDGHLKSGVLTGVRSYDGVRSVFLFRSQSQLVGGDVAGGKQGNCDFSERRRVGLISRINPNNI